MPRKSNFNSPASSARYMSHASLQFFSDIYYFSRIFLILVCVAELGDNFHRMINGHGEALASQRDHFGNPVAHSVRVSQGAGYIAHRAAGHHGAKSSDLRHAVLAIFFRSEE